MAALQALVKAPGTAPGAKPRWSTWHHKIELRDEDRYIAKLSKRGITARIVDECEGCTICLL